MQQIESKNNILHVGPFLLSTDNGWKIKICYVSDWNLNFASNII